MRAGPFIAESRKHALAVKKLREEMLQDDQFMQDLESPSRAEDEEQPSAEEKPATGEASDAPKASEAPESTEKAPDATPEGEGAEEKSAEKSAERNAEDAEQTEKSAEKNVEKSAEDAKQTEKKGRKNKRQKRRVLDSKEEPPSEPMAAPDAENGEMSVLDIIEQMNSQNMRGRKAKNIKEDDFEPKKKGKTGKKKSPPFVPTNTANPPFKPNCIRTALTSWWKHPQTCRNGPWSWCAVHAPSGSSSDGDRGSLCKSHLTRVPTSSSSDG